MVLRTKCRKTVQKTDPVGSRAIVNNGRPAIKFTAMEQQALIERLSKPLGRRIVEKIPEHNRKKPTARKMYIAPLPRPVKRRPRPNIGNTSHNPNGGGTIVQQTPNSPPKTPGQSHCSDQRIRTKSATSVDDDCLSLAKETAEKGTDNINTYLTCACAQIDSRAVFKMNTINDSMGIYTLTQVIQNNSPEFPKITSDMPKNVNTSVITISDDIDVSDVYGQSDLVGNESGYLADISSDEDGVSVVRTPNASRLSSGDCVNGQITGTPMVLDRLSRTTDRGETISSSMPVDGNTENASDRYNTECEDVPDSLPDCRSTSNVVEPTRPTTRSNDRSSDVSSDITHTSTGDNVIEALIRTDCITDEFLISETYESADYSTDASVTTVIVRSTIQRQTAESVDICHSLQALYESNFAYMAFFVAMGITIGFVKHILL